MAAYVQLLSTVVKVSVGEVSRSRSRWGLWACRAMSSLADQFQEAKGKLSTLKEDPGNEAKLKIYGLFKQATVGRCTSSRPGMLDFVGRAKWDSWNALGDMEQDDAKKDYVTFINELAGQKIKVNNVSAAEPGQFETIKVTKDGGMTTVLLNRPDKKNAITLKMYEEIIQAFDDASKDDECSFVVMTGAGDYYCSGNDLSNFATMGSGNLDELARKGADLLNKYISSYIDFPKPLVGIVNGPAVGVSVTVLALFDVVYASDKATFHTPFSQLGQSPEGCSSYLFPKIMGPAKANELLMFNRKITAVEACNRGLVAEVFPEHIFQSEIKAKLEEIQKLPKKSLLYAKQVNRSVEKDVLHKINDVECNNLVERWQSEDCMNAIMAFFQRKSKM